MIAATQQLNSLPVEHWESRRAAEIKVAGMVVPFIVSDGPVAANELANACSFWMHLAEVSGARLIDWEYEARELYNVPAQVFRDHHPVATWMRCVQWFCRQQECDPFEVSIELYQYFGWGKCEGL